MICIKKVKILTGSLKKEAKEKNLDPEDLVIVEDEHIKEKVEGDPVTYLLNRAKEEGCVWKDTCIYANIEPIKCDGKKEFLSEGCLCYRD